MFNPFQYEYNWLAVIAMVVFSMALGFVWYAKGVFGNRWMRFVGLQEDDVKKGPGAGVWVGMIIGSFIETAILAWLVALTYSGTFFEGLLAGFYIWLGFVFTTYMASYMFARRPLGLLIIDTGYNLVFLAIAGGVLGAWQ